MHFPQEGVVPGPLGTAAATSIVAETVKIGASFVLTRTDSLSVEPEELWARILSAKYLIAAPLGVQCRRRGAPLDQSKVSVYGEKI